MAKKGDKVITKETSTKRKVRRDKKTGNTSKGCPAQGN